MPGPRHVVALTLLLVVCAATACSGPAAGPDPEEAPFPSDLTAYLDQSRLQRQDRGVFIRLVQDSEREVTVTRAEVYSPRFDAVMWRGEELIDNEVDLEFDLPRARCGEGSDAEVRLTYRIDAGPEQVSTTTATDRYGAVGLFLDRDCAEESFTEAAALELGDARVVGEGGRSVFEVPITLTPTGARDDVSFGGFEDTVLFRQTRGSASVDTVSPISLRASDAPTEVMLRLVPTRCDPHALAEDKVGTLVGVRVQGPGLPQRASYYLPIGDDRRAALRAFFATYCGL